MNKNRLGASQISTQATHYAEYDVDTRIKPTAGFNRFMEFTEMTPAFEFLNQEYVRIDILVKKQESEHRVVPGLTDETWSHHYAHELYNEALNAGIREKVNFRDFLTDEIEEFMKR